MSEADFERVERLFQAAADLDEMERDGFLDRECAGDAELSGRLKAMLAQHDRGDSLAPAPSVAEVSEGPGASIGRYRLLQRIGEGGFGVVYMAEQTEPVRRVVALKIIKLGMDTKEVIARFEAERQALAMMDHPNIARVLDGGETETGRPYFVMELVRGVSITEYCDANNVEPHERLDLFRTVCQAVQHAHHNGVIHRDLKPTNVMVTLHDGVPVPKVIDFGIAKAIHTRLTERTLFTEYQRFLGTPAYMSPEQAEMSGLDVDTRTDIYALGVLLYELLTGTTPFDTKKLLSRGLAEIQRVIREEEPERPSVRISTAAEVKIASRSIDRRELGRAVRGDLDWIVMKALEKDRTRRYSTASEFGADVERHLQGLPVLAGPPSTVYRLRKFLARNRAAVSAAALVVLTLLVGIVGTTLALFEARRARDDEREARRGTESVTEFLIDTLALTDPGVALRPDVTVRSLLDRAAARVGESFAEQPEAEARVRTVIGSAYASLSENALAEGHLRRAASLFASLERPDLPVYYDCLWTLTEVLFKLEKPDAYTVAHLAREKGLLHVSTSYPELAAVLTELGATIQAGAWRMDGEDVRRGLEIFDRAKTKANTDLVGGDPLWPIISDTFAACGLGLWYTEHDASSEPFYREALRIQRRELPSNHPDTAETLGYLVGVMNRHGKAGEAEGMVRESLDILRGTYADDSFPVAFARSKLGETLVQRRRYAEADEELRAAHRVLVAKSGGDMTFYAIDSHARLVELYDAWNKAELARQHRDTIARAGLESAVAMTWAIQRHAFGPPDSPLRTALERLHQLCGSPSHALAPASRAEIDHAAVERELEKIRAAELPLASPQTAVTARMLVAMANVLAPGATDRSRKRMLEVALPILEHWSDKLPLVLADTHAAFSAVAGSARAAREHARKAWQFVQDAPADQAWYVAIANLRIGRCLVDQAMFAEAESVLRPVYGTFVVQLGRTHADVAAVDALMARLYRAWGKPDAARAYEREETTDPATGARDR